MELGNLIQALRTNTHLVTSASIPGGDTKESSNRCVLSVMYATQHHSTFVICSQVRMQVDTMSVPTSPGRARAFVANHLIAAPPPPKVALNPIQQLGAFFQMLQPANLAKAMRMAMFK